MGMSDVVNRMQGNFGTDRDHYMKSLMRPDLLILDDLGDRRIFDRILEVCVPIRFDGENFRKGNASANIKKAAEMLNG